LFGEGTPLRYLRAERLRTIDMQMAVLIFIGFSVEATLLSSDRLLNLFSMVTIFSRTSYAPLIYNT
jgi:hypothetical protein